MHAYYYIDNVKVCPCGRQEPVQLFAFVQHGT